LILNYHTAYFALLLRGRLARGETVLVHGAAGGVGTASLQSRKPSAPRTIALVSSESKRAVAELAGADHTLSARGALEGRGAGALRRGVDMVLDPVGGDRFTDSPALAARGRAPGRVASPAARFPRCASTGCC